MTETPIIDGAIRAGCQRGVVGANCEIPACKAEPEWGRCSYLYDVVIAALRAANPWEPPPEEIEAMARAAYEAGGYGVWRFVQQTYRAISLATYRARPLMRELYPEKF